MACPGALVQYFRTLFVQKEDFNVDNVYFSGKKLSLFAVAIWPVTGQCFQNTN